MDPDHFNNKRKHLKRINYAISETSEVEKEALSAMAPDFPPNAYYDVAFFTWAVPNPDQQEGVRRELVSRDDPLRYLSLEDIAKIQDWLVTDEVKKYPELEDWVRFVKKLQHKEYNLDSIPAWVWKLSGSLFAGAITAVAAVERKLKTQ